MVQTFFLFSIQPFLRIFSVHFQFWQFFQVQNFFKIFITFSGFQVQIFANIFSFLITQFSQNFFFYKLKKNFLLFQVRRLSREKRDDAPYSWTARPIGIFPKQVCSVFQDEAIECRTRSLRQFNDERYRFTWSASLSTNVNLSVTVCNKLCNFAEGLPTLTDCLVLSTDAVLWLVELLTFCAKSLTEISRALTGNFCRLGS